MKILAEGLLSEVQIVIRINLMSFKGVDYFCKALYQEA